MSIPDIDALTQSKTIEGIPVQAANLAAIVLNVPEDQVNVTVDYTMPAVAEEVSTAWHQAREQLTQARGDVDAKLADLTRALRVSGYTLKDNSALTGYSFQRVSQILKS